MHSSVPVLNSPCELINITQINPLISKCQIKVCYVGEEPNRNRSVITKEVARKMANSLPGSPIVGYYVEEAEDFEQHSRALEINDGEIVFKDITKPYGFVDLNAKVWFQKFIDDGVNEREYLCTEGYLWTGQYPEAQRIIDKGNNQSMELDDKNIDAHWTKSQNGKQEFFIINEAIISKLCILGEDWEPCFEGSTIGKVQFSFEEGFKDQLFSMISYMKKILDEGGAKMAEPNTVIDNEEVIVDEAVVEEEIDTVEETAVVEDEAIEESTDDSEEAVEASEEITEEPAEDVEFAKKDEEDKKDEKVCPKCGKPLSECTCDKGDKEADDKKKKYSLEEIPEYVDLQTVYDELRVQYDELQCQYDAVNAQLAELVEFKRAAERKEKEAMIDSFYMLSDAEKSDVIKNIDFYTVDEIEAKLSVICVRNKVSFNLDDDNNADSNDEGPTTFSLDSDTSDDLVPAWIKSLKATATQEN